MQAAKEKSGELSWEVTPHLGHLEGRMHQELSGFKRLWQEWRQEIHAVEVFQAEWEQILSHCLAGSGIAMGSFHDIYKAVLGAEPPSSYDRGVEGAVYVTACRVRYRLHQALSQASRRRQEMDMVLLELEEKKRMAAMFAMEVELIKLLPPTLRFVALRECYDGLCHVKGLVASALTELKEEWMWKAKEVWRRNPLEVEVLAERWGDALARKQRRIPLLGNLF